MTQMHTRFPKDNHHRLALFFPDRKPGDFERLEDLAADALAAGRTAMQAVQDLPSFDDRTLHGCIEKLRCQIAARKILNEAFRSAAETALRHLDRLDPDDRNTRALDTLQRNLLDALNLCHCVTDLLTAEQEIEWHRGVGR